MTQNRNLSILADQVNSSGVLGYAGGGTGLSAVPTNGQLNIGNGSGFTRATLTAGTGISVTNGAGSISIASTVSGTVTSVATGTGLTGGTITTSGTISLVTTASAVGTYIFATYTTFPATISLGSTVAGSNLRPAGLGMQSAPTGTGNGVFMSAVNSAQSGTWQCMGYSAGVVVGCSSLYGGTLWIRIA